MRYRRFDRVAPDREKTRGCGPSILIWKTLKEIHMIRPVAVTLIVVATSLAPSWAQDTMKMDAHSMPGAAMPAASSAAAQMSQGEVRKVDKEAQKMTIKHGPIPSLDMPPMTMVYRVKDPAMLDQVKPGDKIQFLADKVGGAYTVTKIEPAK
jgi:Cu/Ag efflux protein CusF